MTFVTLGNFQRQLKARYPKQVGALKENVMRNMARARLAKKISSRPNSRVGRRKALQSGISEIEPVFTSSVIAEDRISTTEEQQFPFVGAGASLKNRPFLTKTEHHKQI